MAPSDGGLRGLTLDALYEQYRVVRSEIKALQERKAALHDAITYREHQGWRTTDGPAQIVTVAQGMHVALNPGVPDGE